MLLTGFIKAPSKQIATLHVGVRTAAASVKRLCIENLPGDTLLSREA